ncbi:SDR family oxidoreductase [Bordetella sp. BOR01]|uniref:SDR family oxidoreductase n=1 Tax=Bordetella sp. BOR01 TaxID=2854779 RepID=UPI001C47B228|nr:SDR family oxidoreductase [Bordetella sp. BOR01]MBV7482622.1 SDR family oxidoreductase [Bordetella sp. BOR01]
MNRHKAKMNETKSPESEGSCTRTAIVTGAARGIGAATAIALARRGIHPVLAVRDPAAAEPVRAQIEALGATCTIEPCDVTRDADVAALVAHTLQSRGRLDAVVNNAGMIGPIAHLAEGDADAWAANVATNLLGPYRLARAALPALQAQGGTVLNVSTGAAHTPREGWSAYCSAKAALAMLSRCMAHEYGALGIAVYSFQPGVVDTDMQVQIRASGMNEISRIPREKLAAADHPARVMAWLVETRPEDLRGQELSIADESLLARAMAAASAGA